MKHVNAALLLWLVVFGTLARDPFAPLAPDICQQQTALLTNWRLLGVIGKNNRYHAWLMTPDGVMVHVQQQQPFALPFWKVSRISATGMTLTASAQCPPFSLRFQWKGKHNDKDSYIVPAVD